MAYGTTRTNHEDKTHDSCHRPVITSISILHPSGRIQVCYTLPIPCDSCTLFVYNVSNIPVAIVTNICGTSCTAFKFLDTCTHYRFLIKCHNDTCGWVASDTAYYVGCEFFHNKGADTPVLSTGKKDHAGINYFFTRPQSLFARPRKVVAISWFFG